MENMRLFFNNVGNILPCGTCGRSYNNLIKELPIDPYLKSRKDLIGVGYTLLKLFFVENATQTYPDLLWIY